MLLEKIDAAKKSFTLKFADSDVVYVNFGADKYGFNEMKVEVSRKDEEGTFVERFAILYTWNSEMEEMPAFVMDMMGLLHKVGKMDAAVEEEEVEGEVVVEEVVEEEAEEVVDEEEEEGDEIILELDLDLGEEEEEEEDEKK
jgi:uncharacterized membrane protein